MIDVSYFLYYRKVNCVHSRCAIFIILSWPSPWKQTKKVIQSGAPITQIIHCRIHNQQFTFTFELDKEPWDRFWNPSIQFQKWQSSTTWTWTGNHGNVLETELTMFTFTYEMNFTICVLLVYNDNGSVQKLCITRVSALCTKCLHRPIVIINQQYTKGEIHFIYLHYFHVFWFF